MAYIPISLKDNTGSLNRLPYLTENNQPVFCWELPEGIVQAGYCLELKSRFPTTLSDGSYGFAYYNSSLVEDATKEHQVNFEMYQRVWSGIIEIRLRIYGSDKKLLYSTHDESNYMYPFEEIPQGFAWDSTYDGYYYLLDSTIEKVSGVMNPTFQWRNVVDEDLQTVSYQMQWSRTPLFLDGVYGQLGLSGTQTLDVVGDSGLRTSFDTVVDAKAPIFYRVRAFDGLDYSDWSQVNGFHCNPSSAPFCVFNNVESNCTSGEDGQNILQRPNGEVDISFRVVDLDSSIVTAYLLYKLDGVEYPCSLNCSTVSIPANEDITVTWLSARQLPNKNVIVYIYLYAYDGNSESDKIVWESSVVVNNTGIGFGYNDGTNDKLEYRFSGALRNYERYIQIPKEKSQVVFQDGKAIYRPVPIPEGTEEGYRFDWATYWSNKLGNNLSQYLYTVEEQLNFVHQNFVKRTSWNLYDGYDSENERSEKDKLYLEYKDDFEGRDKEKNEQFFKYFGEENGSTLKTPELGRGISSITYFVKTAEFGRGFSIHRPTIVKAGTMGLYFDGAGLNNKSSDYVSGGSNGGASDTKAPQGADELLKKEIWKTFYQVDPMFYPEVKYEATFVGPKNSSRYDRENGWYWTLFEYHVELVFPFNIQRGVNDKFSYRFNGYTYEDSILESEEDSVYFTYSPSIPSKLQNLLKKVFSTSIFQEIKNIDYSNGKYLFDVYSRWTDYNKTFQFVGVEGNCYSLFGVDQNLRFSKRSLCTGETDNHVTYNPYKEEKDSENKFEVDCDTGDCIGEEGEINTTEPLFTCDPDHLNQYGCHYKYTLKRFLLSGKVYIRKYSVKPVYATKSQEPLFNGSSTQIGYRNYHLKYIGENALGEPLYEKDCFAAVGGVPAQCRQIKVSFEKKEIEDIGYWKPYTDFEDPKLCISHNYDENTKIYTRKNPNEFVKEIGIQDCFCTEYVELNEGWEKPFFDWGQNASRLDKRQPIFHNGEIPQGYIQYVMGAYKPPKSQKEKVSSYENEFVSVVESEEGKELGRYNNNWDDSGSSRFSEKQGTVVDPMFIEPGGYERSIEKWGYVPDKTLQTYFKKDETNIWKDRIIPKNNSYVHEIYKENDISFASKMKLHLFRRIISDTNKIEMPESEGVKAPYLDYRIGSHSPLEEKYYYSALPKEESEAYATRPDAIYEEDRPTRISGFIDSMVNIVTWKFLYLQTEWNSYNLIHWEGSQDENVYAKIEVAEVNESNRPGSFMTLKTKNAEWFPKYSSWLIPYEKLKQSDYIDTLNGTFSSVQDGFKTDYHFEDNHRYMFRICGMNVNTGATNDYVLSSIFTYSQNAYSPPVITNVEYDKWSHEFEIEFRFDDAKGRKYDIINFYYAAYDSNSSSPSDAAFIQLGTEVLEGALIDLDSNVLGDNVVSESYLKKHKVFLSSDYLNGIEGKNIRFRLEGIASEDRVGMTAPVFNFRMWCNEFLKKADEDIDSVVGKKNRWVFEASLNDDGEVVEQWKYLPEEEAVIVPGILTEQNEVISKVNEKFEDWYLTVAKFPEPSFDARYNHLCLQGKDEELYSACFDAFVESQGLSTEWTQFKKTRPGKQDSYLKPLFITKQGYTETFAFFWENKASSLIQSLSSFDSWFEDNKMLSQTEAKPLFIQENNLSEEYQKYLEGKSLTDTDDTRTLFITDGEYQESFNRYFTLLNNYPDGRYDDRKAFIEANYPSLFLAWKTNPVNAYGEPISSNLISLDDDAYRLFIAHDRAIWERMVYTNQGKRDAKNYFLTSSENGVTYGQQIQTANSLILGAQQTLNEAYVIRNHYETIHRRKLISKGYFSNGWKNNQVYTEKGVKNEVFRFRVENQPTSGSRTAKTPEIDFGSSLPETVAPIAGYDTRWEVYFHFQLDFYDSFDSQNGKPLRDYLWQRLDCSGYSGSDYDALTIDGVSYIRIMGAIEADSGMHVLPSDLYTPSSGDYAESPTTSDPYSYQLAGRFSIPKTELPGELPGESGVNNTVLPEYWNRNETGTSDDFNQLYFWRVCPYNVVERPLFEKERCVVKSMELLGQNRNNKNVWKIKLNNSFFGNHKYSKLAANGSNYYVWVATTTNVNMWRTDYRSLCWNEFDSFYNNFFHGTGKDRMDVEIDENPVRESYQTRLQRGEIVFLTDRPRELVEGKLQYIEESTNHFNSLWIPFNTNRSRPQMWFDEDEKCWFLVYQKLSKNRTGYSEYVIILARGMSPQTFGEECQLFPVSTMQSVESVLPGAKSFESPWMLKKNGVYELFFRVRKDEGLYEVWKATSRNFYDWKDFEKVNFSNETQVLGFSVYLQNEKYTMYAVQGTVINKYTSEDGVNFVLLNAIYADAYTITCPSLCNSRVFFGMEFAGKGKIVSISESGDYETLKVEKGSACDFEQAVTFDATDLYFSPMVFNDFDKGVEIQRVVYEKVAPVYAYDGSELKQLSVTERAFFTEYVEKYIWTKTLLNDSSVVDDYWGSRIYVQNKYQPIIKDSTGANILLTEAGKYIPTGELEVLVIVDGIPLQVKFPFYQEGFEEIESEGEWLDYHNAGKTSAWLNPEDIPEDYDPKNYTMDIFISENDLTSEYEKWMSEHYPNRDPEKEEQYQTEFLLNCKQYSVYLKWSKKGPGVYNYLSAVKRSSYVGDGTNVVGNQ